MSSIFNIITYYRDTPEDREQLIDFIQTRPQSLYEFKMASVYSWAVAKSMHCLVSVHTAAEKVELDENKPHPSELPDLGGNTALHHCIKEGTTEILRYLISTVKMNVNSRNGSSETPLFLAIKSSKIEMVKLLLASGAKVNSINKQRLSPLALAVNFGEIEIVKLLLAKNAPIVYKMTALTQKNIINMAHNPDIKKLLVDKLTQQQRKLKTQRRHERHFDRMDHFRQKYDFVCDSLEDLSNYSEVQNLAEILGLNKDLPKHELCKRISQRIILQFKNSDVFTS